MKKLITVIFTIAVGLQVTVAQKAEDASTSMREFQKGAAGWKKEAASIASIASPADYNDTASFGKNAKFLGSLYAGSLFVYRSCDPQVLLDELELTLAADDHCIVHNSTTPMLTTSVFDPVWQITIPANTVENVIYPMLNNTVGYDALPSDPSVPGGNNGYPAGFASIRFTPVVMIESTAVERPGRDRSEYRIADERFVYREPLGNTSQRIHRQAR